MTGCATSLDPQPSGNGGTRYGSYYHRHDCGVPYQRNEPWMTFFGAVADNIVRNLRPASVLDAGCAMGFLVEALRSRGVEAWGVDVSKYAISQVHDSVREYCSVASLTEPLPRRYDLITCIEVVEHIPAPEAEKVIANLCAATHRLLLSTSPHDYSEPTQVNVQPPGAWSEMLAREGFLRDFAHDASYLTPWAALYTRRDEPFAQTVRRYDDSWWQLQWELSETRSSLAGLHERLEHLHTGESESRPEVLGELDSHKEEVLRLRDLLIGKEAELGTLKGRLTQLEEEARSDRKSTARLRARLAEVLRRVRMLLNPKR
jgi:SAM-dependent methyltransferase